MDRDVGAGIAARDPLGELLAADRLRLQQRAVAVVDVPQDAIDDVGPQLLVIGIGELVIDDLGQHALLPSEGLQFIEFLQAQDGGLLDQDVLAGGESGSRRVEMAIVGRGDADGIDALAEQLLDGVRSGAVDERARCDPLPVAGSARRALRCGWRRPPVPPRRSRNRGDTDLRRAVARTAADRSRRRSCRGRPCRPGDGER